MRSERGEAVEIAEYPRSDTPMRDAIGEEDNPIPGWFNLGFYGLMVFGVIYIVLYLTNGWSQRTQYEEEVARAAERADAFAASQPAPTRNPYSGDAAAIAEGQQVFATICSACHKPDATGLVGPSLVDPYWKYGNSDAERFESVAEGRPLGMPPWLAQLGTEKIWKSLAYLESLPKQDEPGVGAPDFAAPAPGS
jgi:cytochrome c oxidase cbb3-type subunit 3